MEKETLGTLQAYMRLADELVEHVSKEQLGECARVLALNLKLENGILICKDLVRANPKEGQEWYLRAAAELRKGETK